MLYATLLLALLILGNAWLFHTAFWMRARLVLRAAETADREEAEAKYRFLAVDLLGAVIFFIIAPVLGFTWYHIIKAIVGAFEQVPPDVIISLPPLSDAWLLAALFLAIFGSAVPIDLLYRSMLRERYQAYANASFRRNPGAFRKLWMMPWLNWGVSIVIVALLAMSINSYAHFRADSIALNPFFGLNEARHAYSDVSEIAQVARYRSPIGDLKDRSHIAIRFVDGSVWTSIEGGRSSDPDLDERILELLQERTGLSPAQVDTYR